MQLIWIYSPKRSNKTSMRDVLSILKEKDNDCNRVRKAIKLTLIKLILIVFIF